MTSPHPPARGHDGAKQDRRGSDILLLGRVWRNEKEPHFNQKCGSKYAVEGRPNALIDSADNRLSTACCYHSSGIHNIGHLQASLVDSTLVISILLAPN